jgi:hypothetical protein
MLGRGMGWDGMGRWVWEVDLGSIDGDIGVVF